MNKLNYKYETLTPFKICVLENFPFLEADFDALTNNQIMCKLAEYINKVAKSQNIVQENIIALNNWFNSLDVQDEINNKLDAMAESGQLTEIVSQYLQISGILAFNTISDMKLSNNLVNGSFAKTYGENSLLDGKGRFYKIRTIQNSDVVDNVNIIALNNPNLIAELIPEQYLQNILAYDTINDMKESDNLVNGSFAKTYGENSLLDGKGRFYKIRTKQNSDIVDNVNIIALNNPNLIAELIPEKYLQDIEDLKSDLIPFACIIRPTSNGWIILNDTDHEPLNVQNIEVDVQGRLVLTHNNNASKIYGFSISSDETFAKYNINAGASVGQNISLISIFINTTAIAYFRYTNSQISIDSKYSNLVKSVEWNELTNKMEITFDDNLRCHYMSNWKVSPNNASLNNDYDYFCSWEDSLKLSVVAYDKATHTAQPLSGAYDRLMVSADFEGFINANDLISHPISSANFWITGWLKK